jgi:ABC-type transporter Mla subunit MlaD
VDYHVHVHLPEHDDLLQVLHVINTTLQKGFGTMSEASDALSAAVNNVAHRFDTLNATLQQEMQDIRNALTQTGDDELRQVAMDSASRLDAVAQQMEAMNVAIQGIIQ